MAKRNISANEEISISYGTHYWTNKIKLNRNNI